MDRCTNHDELVQNFKVLSAEVGNMKVEQGQFSTKLDNIPVVIENTILKAMTEKSEEKRPAHQQWDTKVLLGVIAIVTSLVQVIGKLVESVMAHAQPAAALVEHASKIVGN